MGRFGFKVYGVRFSFAFRVGMRIYEIVFEGVDVFLSEFNVSLKYWGWEGSM